MVRVTVWLMSKGEIIVPSLMFKWTNHTSTSRLIRIQLIEATTPDPCLIIQLRSIIPYSTLLQWILIRRKLKEIVVCLQLAFQTKSELWNPLPIRLHLNNAPLLVVKPPSSAIKCSIHKKAWDPSNSLVKPIEMTFLPPTREKGCRVI